MSRFLENYSKLFSKVFTNICSVIYNKKITEYKMKLDLRNASGS